MFLLLLGLKRKTFEYHFCLVFQDQQLSCQALFHLRLLLKDKNLKLECIWKGTICFEIQNFLPFLCDNSKNFEHKSCLSFENLQLWFWTKIHLSYDLKFIFKTRLFPSERHLKHLKTLIWRTRHFMCKISYTQKHTYIIFQKKSLTWISLAY